MPLRPIMRGSGDAVDPAAPGTGDHPSHANLHHTLPSDVRGRLRNMSESGYKPEDFGAVRMDKERIQRLKELARKEDRSIAAVLRRLVDAELEREGQAA